MLYIITTTIYTIYPPIYIIAISIYTIFPSQLVKCCWQPSPLSEPFNSLSLVALHHLWRRVTEPKGQTAVAAAASDSSQQWHATWGMQPYAVYDVMATKTQQKKKQNNSINWAQKDIKLRGAKKQAGGNGFGRQHTGWLARLEGSGLNVPNPVGDITLTTQSNNNKHDLRQSDWKCA